jgi:hypothetical protein
MATKAAEIHEVKETLVIRTYYPGHEKRTISSTFRKTRKYLLKVKKEKCFICGCEDDLEIHHCHVEWAMQNAVDWEKLKVIHPTFDWANFKRPVDFIDSPYNSMVLCEKHHRENNHGVHCLPYPLWIMQKHARTDFDLDASDGKFDPSA